SAFRKSGIVRSAGVLAAELVHAAASVDDLLLARVERVALRAHFDLYILAHGGASLEGVAAAAGHLDRLVLGMNFGLHVFLGKSVWIAGIRSEPRILKTMCQLRKRANALGVAG